MNKDLKDKLKKLGLKSSRIGGTGSMRMKAKRRRPKKQEDVEEPYTQELNQQVEQVSNVQQPLDSDDDIPELTIGEDFKMLDNDIQTLEEQLKDLTS